MATCTIGFRNPEFGDYTDLSFDEAREAVMDELKKSIQDQGSDGYDLIWVTPAGINPDNSDDIQRWLDQLSASEAEQQTAEAHERGVTKAAQDKFTTIWSDLMLNKRATLPGGVVITFSEQR